MGRLCAVVSCVNSKVKLFRKGVKVHEFPLDKNTRSKCINAIGQEEDTKNFEINSSYYGICENHFTEENFELSSRKKLKLKPGATPSLNNKMRELIARIT